MLLLLLLLLLTWDVQNIADLYCNPSINPDARGIPDPLK
jgi:hypothetical protein